MAAVQQMKVKRLNWEKIEVVNENSIWGQVGAFFLPSSDALSEASMMQIVRFCALLDNPDAELKILHANYY